MADKTLGMIAASGPRFRTGPGRPVTDPNTMTPAQVLQAKLAKKGQAAADAAKIKQDFLDAN